MSLILLSKLIVFFVMTVNITVNQVTWLHILAYVILGCTQYKSSEFELHTKWFSFKSSKKK